MTKEVFLLNTTIHFHSEGLWEYEVRQRRTGDDPNFYLWTLDGDLICVVPNSKLSLNQLYSFVLPKCKEYEKKYRKTEL